MGSWDKREKLFKQINLVVLVIYVAVSLVVLYQGIQTNYSRAVLYSVISLGLLFIPILVSKLFKMTLPADSRFFYYLFCFGAVEFGSAMDGYDLLPWWDLFLHCLSGALAGVVGLVIFNALQKNKGQVRAEDGLLMACFVNFFATTTAAAWEYYEFVLDHFFGFTAQLVATTGVGDTMTDMMVCTLGGLVISILIYRHYGTSRKGWMMATIDHYYYRNQK